MKTALIQTNPTIGAFERNLAVLFDRLRQAEQQGCGLAIFPELALCGYPPQDLLERRDFLQAHDQALDELIAAVGETGVIVGAVERRRSGPGKSLHNSALLIHQGKVVQRVQKQLLPTYDVFDESRYFESGGPALPVSFGGLRLGLTVCEDIWQQGQYSQDPVAALCRAGSGPSLLINISASPYHHGKLGERRRIFASLCQRHKLPLLYVNQVGGQDSLIFDGHSAAVNAQGEICAAAAGFREDMLIIDTDELRGKPACAAPEDSIAQVEAALVLGLRDYLHKTGFHKAVIGLSGGIDSAVTAVLAALALGPENVLGVALPSPYTAQMSIDDAQILSRNLGCGFEIIPIAGAMTAYQQALAPLFVGLAEDVTEQNIQARIRGNLLMALSNKFGGMLLSTGNKSEMAVGYCTLYGDMSGGLAVLADLPKVMVYELARWMNRNGEVIPERIITRPPTAELKPDQLDQDDLPPYEVLDPILAAYLEEHCSTEEIAAWGFAQETVRSIIRRILRNEHKRKQAALGLKVTSKAFGYGRRWPIAQGLNK
ncbi:MAG: NAD+ synthase [Candidatus Electronema sp. V4]|uniref:NAD+ synthase n=1 Tax=Candidatus Electronema sp. V4 TaxID=3454756 RepID=UPI0040558077